MDLFLPHPAPPGIGAVVVAVLVGALARAPLEMLVHGQTVLAEVMPFLGMCTLAMIVLLAVAARRHRLPAEPITLPLHALPAALLALASVAHHLAAGRRAAP